MKLELKDINLRRLVYTRRYLLVAILAGMLSIVITLFAIFPQTSQVFTTYEDVQREDVVLKNLQRKVSGLAQVEYLQEYANKSKVELALPSEKPLLQLLAAANAVAQKEQIRLIDIETTPGRLASQSARTLAAARTTITDPTAAKVHGVDTLSILVTVEGTLPQVNAFITQIEKTTPITNVSQIKLEENEPPKNAAVRPETPTFIAELRLTTYYFTRAIDVAVDSPLPETSGTEQQFLALLDSFFFPDVQKFQEVQGGGSVDLFKLGIGSPQ